MVLVCVNPTLPHCQCPCVTCPKTSCIWTNCSRVTADCQTLPPLHPKMTPWTRHHPGAAPRPAGGSPRGIFTPQNKITVRLRTGNSVVAWQQEEKKTPPCLFFEEQTSTKTIARWNSHFAGCSVWLGSTPLSTWLLCHKICGIGPDNVW